ncbi:hypothetical protein [Mucilaginibacter ginsenosidivorans]|uniref:PH domain-containing protein n=1 Tax=Mucilaginibacter ginsenosidivorans TaxID=398053 RepID=A0A5B8V1A7_9SPHI|nr:hypothetical protein [Mucilaginibacter ginsenosidivorans]QEC65297.1 hypothetical protein FRZ54_22900 [Mucilaginibacter ginsenosidivorans]
MKKTKEFVFKKKSIVIEIFALIIFLIGIIFSLIKTHHNPTFFLFASAILAALAYLQFYELYMIRQFNFLDKGKKMIINSDNSKLTITKNGKEISIDRDDVNKVEIFEQKSLGKFGTYNYIIIYTSDFRKLLVTKFTIPLLAYDTALQSFLRKKPRICYRKFFNYIDKRQFDI